jgi:geranylgeranyl diphosphate synthase type I
VTDIDEVLGRVRGLVDPAMRAAIDGLDNEIMRRVAGYQMGFVNADGSPAEAGGKAIRPAFTVLAAEVLGAPAEQAVPAAVAVELVHNFSLLHDDVMDRDVVRRHRPTGWVVFGEGQAILAGNAMLVTAIDALQLGGNVHCLPVLLSAIQELIAGQSEDLDLEGRTGVTVDNVMTMEAGKTAALLACATAIGAVAAGADRESVALLRAFGHDVGIAFQLVDDILGITGDPARTGKSSSSDIRANKRSAPIVAALSGSNSAAQRLGDMLANGPLVADEDVALASKLVGEAGGLDFAVEQADARLADAMARLDQLDLPAGATEPLAALARYVVDRDR